MSVVEFSQKVTVEGQLTRQQLRRLAAISRKEGGAQLDSWDIACIRSVVEALRVTRWEE